MFENYEACYVNFEPTHGFRLYTHSLLTKLLDLVPSDSAAHTRIQKQGTRYICKIDIISNSIRFATSSECLHPQSALSKARRKLNAQLAKWHGSRFLATLNR